MSLTVHVYLHGEQDGFVDLAKRLTLMEKRIMASLDDIISSEDDESGALTVLATGVQSLIDGQIVLQKQISDLLAGVTLPPAVQAKIDAAFAKSATNIQSIKDTIAKLPVPEAPPA